MKKILTSKYLIYAIVFLAIGFSIQTKYCSGKENDRLKEYNRQLSGQLTELEVDLQEANDKLGVAKSTLTTQEQLNEELKKEKNEVDEEFNKFKDKHDLIIKSKDRAIARLEQEIIDGHSGTIVTPDDEVDVNLCLKMREKCNVSYEWKDRLGRFSLEDPNVFIEGNEIFKSSQLFKLTGEIYEQKEGSLQTRRLVLREVYEENGQYREVKNGKAEIVAHDFKYHNPPSIETESNWTDVFRIRAVSIASISLFSDTGSFKLGLGCEFLNWQGFGVNTHIAIDFVDISKWEHRIGLAYSPHFLDFELNFAIGVSVGTPYSRFGQLWSINTGLIFYLHN